MANSPNPSPQDIIGYLGHLGYSPSQAAAITGNIEQESGFNPNNLNKGEGAYGLLQWRGPRLDGLKQFAASNGTSPNDWQTQLNYVKYEMGGPEAKSASGFLSSQSVPDANAALHQYIRYGDNSEGTRLRNAENYAGAPVSGPAPPQYASNAPMTPGAQAPALPPPTTIGGAPISGPQAPAAAPQQAATPQGVPPGLNIGALAGLMGGGMGSGAGGASQMSAPQAPPVAPMPQNPIGLMAMLPQHIDTSSLQALLKNSPALGGLLT